jgi:uncharacterized protein (TIGR02145 family)
MRMALAGMALIGFIVGCDDGSAGTTTGTSGGSSTGGTTAATTSGGGTTGATTGGTTGGTGSTGGTGPVMDSRDGKSYPIVVIGTQTWLAENMNYEAPTGSFCYGNDVSNCATYGRLYTFATAAQVCPTGTHLPTDAEWKTLETTLGMAANQLDIDGEIMPRGTTEGTALKVGGTSGFGAKLSGYFNGSSFYLLTTDGYFWTSTEAGGEVWRRHVDSSTDYLYRFQNPPVPYAISVRCVM